MTRLELPGPSAPADFSERSELALDSRKKRKNYPNPLTVSVHASRGLPVLCCVQYTSRDNCANDLDDWQE